MCKLHVCDAFIVSEFLHLGYLGECFGQDLIARSNGGGGQLPTGRSSVRQLGRIRFLRLSLLLVFADVTFLVAVVACTIFLGWLVATTLGGRSTLLSKCRSLGNHKSIAHTRLRKLVKHPKDILAGDRVVVVAFGEVFLKTLLEVSVLFTTIQEEVCCARKRSSVYSVMVACLLVVRLANSRVMVEVWRDASLATAFSSI